MIQFEKQMADHVPIKGQTVQSLVKFVPVVLVEKILNAVIIFLLHVYFNNAISPQYWEWFLIITPNNVLYQVQLKVNRWF